MPYANPADAVRARKKHNSVREMRRRATMAPDVLRAYYRDKKREERARKRAKAEAVGALVWGNALSREEKQRRSNLQDRRLKGHKRLEPIKVLIGSRTQTWFKDDAGTVHESWCPCHDCLHGPLAVRQGLLRGLAPTVAGAEDGVDACVRLVRDPVGVRRRSGGGHASQH